MSPYRLSPICTNPSYSRRIFESLDCVVQPSPSPGEVTVNPPSVSPSTPEGKRSRAKLLRAWIEVSAWLTLYHKSRPSTLYFLFQSIALNLSAGDPNFVPSPLCVNVESATEMIQTGLGAHINQSRCSRFTQYSHSLSI